jgi:hypothetical protein
MAFIHGKSGKFLVGSTDFQVVDFGIDWSMDLDDITHTGASGAQVMLAGIERLEGNVTFVYDTSAKPTVSPQQLKPGTSAVIHFKPDGTDDFTATCICEKFSWKSGPSAGAVKVTVNVKSSGAISSPAS